MSRGPEPREPLVVLGGSDGIAAVLAEVDAAGRLLDDIGGRLYELSEEVSRLAASPDLLAAGVLVPVEVARAQGALLALAGPAGLLGQSAKTQALGRAVRAAAVAYRRAESAAEAVVDGADHLAGYLVGRLTGTAVLPAVVAGTPTILLSGAVILTNPTARDLAALAIRRRSDLGRQVVAELGTGIDRALYDHPWITDHTSESLEGLLTGLGDGLPPIGWWFRWRSIGAKTGYPPLTQEGALRVVLAIARGTALDEGGQRIRVTAHPRADHHAPRDLADLVDDRGRASGQRNLRVIGVPQADGSWAWIVDIPGTQDFTPFAGVNPWDSTSNLRLEAGLTTSTMIGVERALTDAQARVGGLPEARRRDRVLLSGHSQGGITAAALAAHPQFRARHTGLTHVVTSGAPIARMDLPPEVHVLSLEHEQDLVPRLDGQDNPDRPNWVTVRRDLSDELGRAGRSTQAHDGHLYAETAALAEAQAYPSVASWLSGIEPYLDRDGTKHSVVIDYELTRVAQAR